MSLDATVRKLGSEILVEIEEVDDEGIPIMLGSLSYCEVGKPNSIQEVGSTENVVGLLSLAKEMARQGRRRVVVQLREGAGWQPHLGKLSPLKAPDNASYVLYELEPTTVKDVPLEEMAEIMEGLENVLALFSRVAEPN